MKNSLVSNLTDMLKGSYLQGEWAVEWQEPNRFVELIVQVPLDNPSQGVFHDMEGQSLASPDFIYEGRILFYDTQKTVLDSGQYWLTVPVDGTKGVAYGQVLTVVKYLRSFLKNLPRQWEAFVQDPKGEVFLVDWSLDQLEDIQQSLKDSYRFNETRLFLPDRLQS